MTAHARKMLKGWCENCGRETQLVLVLSRGAEKAYCIDCGAVCMAFFAQDGESGPRKAGPAAREESGKGIALVLGAGVEEAQRTARSLVDEGRVRRALACESGDDLISRFTNALIQEVRVSLVVIDSPSGGFEPAIIARAVRAVEKAFRRKEPAALLISAPPEGGRQLRPAAELSPARILRGAPSVPLWERVEGTLKK